MKKVFSILALLGLSSFPALAQAENSEWFATLHAMDSGQLTLLAILGMVLLVIVILLVLMVYLMSFMATVLRRENPEMANEPTWWESFKERYVTGTVDEVGGKE